MMFSSSLTKHEEPSSLALLQDYLKGDMKDVDQVIDEQLSSSAPLIPQLGRHLIQAGGKRLRPLLTLASNRLFGSKSPSVFLLAAAVEFIHTATLLHDDVVDNSKVRRGLETANEIWGNQSSVLVGDFLFAKSFQLMVETQSFDVLSTLSQASARIAEGEVLQLSLCHDFSITLDDLLSIISAKTAELFGSACKVGAIIADQDQGTTHALYQYGHNLGMAFQIVDDILDYGASSQVLGKTVGDDFREGKITLPAFLSFQSCVDQGNEQGQLFWKKAFAAEERTAEDLKIAQRLIVDSGGIAAAFKIAQEFSQAAQESLAKLPAYSIQAPPIQEYFYGLVNELLIRRF